MNHLTVCVSCTFLMLLIKHPTFLHKIKHLGFDNKACKWYQSYQIGLKLH